ncbi:probable 39S ribosomal protein L49, mitochondrial [Agrilus planipennis]|uniref:Large ribosomal subunit protein mL49 n=1 Tax=Agrilus planipennis TaxID=224129 RepID=A0A1W4X290_AGRPL|nr:probable 39S ribosomal protein L49, mitochondrial [Agrilus planipennis]
MASYYQNLQQISKLTTNFLSLVQKRQSTYYSSPLLSEIGKVKVKYSVSKSPEEWKYVERLLPPLTVPEPVPKETYLSEWRPQLNECLKEKYFIQRTKNHMIPVYLKIGQHGIRKVTIIKNIKGDIWALEQELRDFLQKETPKPLRSQVNEFAAYIRIYGDYVNAIKYWLTEKKI